MRLPMFATSSQWNVKRLVLAMSEPESNFAFRKRTSLRCRKDKSSISVQKREEQKGALSS